MWFSLVTPDPQENHMDDDEMEEWQGAADAEYHEETHWDRSQEEEHYYDEDEEDGDYADEGFSAEEHPETDDLEAYEAHEIPRVATFGSTASVGAEDDRTAQRQVAFLEVAAGVGREDLLAAEDEPPSLDLTVPARESLGSRIKELPQPVEERETEQDPPDPPSLQVATVAAGRSETAPAVQPLGHQLPLRARPEQDPGVTGAPARPAAVRLSPVEQAAGAQSNAEPSAACTDAQSASAAGSTRQSVPVTMRHDKHVAQLDSTLENDTAFAEGHAEASKYRQRLPDAEEAKGALGVQGATGATGAQEAKASRGAQESFRGHDRPLAAGTEERSARLPLSPVPESPVAPTVEAVPIRIDAGPAPIEHQSEATLRIDNPGKSSSSAAAAAEGTHRHGQGAPPATSRRRRAALRMMGQREGQIEQNLPPKVPQDSTRGYRAYQARPDAEAPRKSQKSSKAQDYGVPRSRPKRGDESRPSSVPRNAAAHRSGVTTQPTRGHHHQLNCCRRNCFALLLVVLISFQCMLNLLLIFRIEHPDGSALEMKGWRPRFVEDVWVQVSEAVWGRKREGNMLFTLEQRLNDLVPTEELANEVKEVMSPLEQEALLRDLEKIEKMKLRKEKKPAPKSFFEDVKGNRNAVAGTPSDIRGVDTRRASEGGSDYPKAQEGTPVAVGTQPKSVARREQPSASLATGVNAAGDSLVGGPEAAQGSTEYRDRDSVDERELDDGSEEEKPGTMPRAQSKAAETRLPPPPPPKAPLPELNEPPFAAEHRLEDLLPPPPPPLVDAAADQGGPWPTQDAPTPEIKPEPKTKKKKRKTKKKTKKKPSQTAQAESATALDEVPSLEDFVSEQKHKYDLPEAAPVPASEADPSPTKATSTAEKATTKKKSKKKKKKKKKTTTTTTSTTEKSSTESEQKKSENMARENDREAISDAVQAVASSQGVVALGGQGGGSGSKESSGPKLKERRGDGYDFRDPYCLSPKCKVFNVRVCGSLFSRLYQMAGALWFVENVGISRVHLYWGNKEGVSTTFGDLFADLPNVDMKINDKAGNSIPCDSSLGPEAALNRFANEMPAYILPDAWTVDASGMPTPSSVEVYADIMKKFLGQLQPSPLVKSALAGLNRRYPFVDAIMLVDSWPIEAASTSKSSLTLPPILRALLTADSKDGMNVLYSGSPEAAVFGEVQSLRGRGRVVRIDHEIETYLRREAQESNERRVQELATVATIFVAGWTDIFQGTRREGSGRDASRLALLLWTAKHPEMALACRHGGTSTLFPCEKGEVAR